MLFGFQHNNGRNGYALYGGTEINFNILIEKLCMLLLKLRMIFVIVS